MSIRHHPQLLFVLAVVAVAVPAPVPAVDEIRLRIGRVSGANWSTGEVELTLGESLGPTVRSELQRSRYRRGPKPDALRAPKVVCMGGE